MGAPKAQKPSCSGQSQQQDERAITARGARQGEHAMSIDTYDTLAMIRPGASARYNLDWIEQPACEVTEGGGATVPRKPAFPRGHRICLSQNGVELSIYYSDHIALESKEIAAEYGAPCRGSKVRFELLGSDLDLVLMNHHQRICERLHRTGDFILFSGQAGLLFEGEVKA
jgi:hypothetical protein